MTNWLKNTSTNFKVALAPIISIIFLVFIGAAGMWANSKLTASVHSINAERIPVIKKVSELRLELETLDKSINQSFAWEGAGFKADKITELDKKISVALKEYEEKIKLFKDNGSLSAAEAEQVLKIEQTYARYHKLALDALDIKSGMISNAVSFMGTLSDEYAALDNSFGALIVFEQRLGDQVASDSEQLAQKNDIFLISCTIAAVIIAGGVTVLGIYYIVSPLRAASALAATMARGDFTERAVDPSTDATGQVLTAMSEIADQLSEIVGNIQISADTVGNASNEIADGNHELSSRTQNTALLLENANQSLDELAQGLARSTQSASAASQQAAAAAQVAVNGGEAVQDVVRTMNLISEQAKKISEIISVIDSIAFQTNILALNAAVEAARAGDQGRGFAVVASEVRILAKRSAEAAKEIRTLISNTVERVESGSVRAAVAGQTMGQVVGSIQAVNTTVQDIYTSITAQSSKIRTVHSTISQVDADTQQNTAMVEEAAASAESLRHQAVNLAAAISKFKVL